MTRSFGLRAALIMLVLIAIAPVFAVVVQASLEEQRGRLERAEASLRGLVDFGAAVAYVAVDIGQIDGRLRAMALSPEMTLLVVDAGGLALASAGAGAVPVGSRPTEEFLRRAIAGGQHAGRATGADGREWVYAVEPVGRPGERKLFVAGMASLDDVLAPSALRLRAQLAALALITLLAAGVAWTFADRILLRPVRQLLGRVDQLAREDQPLGGKAAGARVRELAELNLRFHDMARRLAERSVQRDGAMAEMGHQKTLLESVLAGMAEGVLVVDPQGRFVHRNEAAQRILAGIDRLNPGRPGHELRSQDWGMFELDGVTPWAPQRWPLRRALQGEAVENFRCRVRGMLSGGQEKIIQANAQPVRTPDGRPAGAVLVFSDATQAWHAEQAQRSMNETLERRVDERTRELFIANKELESFSYSVSHDLRAPLQVIDGFGRALLSRHAAQLDSQGRHYLDRIRDNTHQMSQLIDDLLGLARVTRAELRLERLDLAAAAALAVERLRQRFPEREMQVQIEPALACEGDSRLLGVVLQNLLENAWKFTARSPRPWVRVGRRQGPRGEEVFYVADNGAGFDMTYADKLFAPFQRLHSAAEFEGTGIGLATVHRIIARHGGRVWAEGSPGNGATFLFSLTPGASDEEHQDPAGRGQPGPPGTHLDDTGGKQRPQ